MTIQTGPDHPTGVDTSKENLLCLMLLDDVLAAELGFPAAAFWRAFIVENRTTKTITANYRFRYPTKDYWFSFNPKEQGSRIETVADIYFSLAEMLLRVLHIFAPKNNAHFFGAVKAFYPPEPEDCMKTMDWITDQDLIEITVVEEQPRWVH